MTEVGSVYGQSLYELAKDEGLSTQIAEELAVLEGCFQENPAYIRLLSSPSLPKAERCQVLDEGFRGRVHPYLLNFLKILTEKSYVRYFSDCCGAYTQRYDQDNGILRVQAVTAVALTQAQQEKLSEKLSRLTGKKVLLVPRIDPAVLGGIRLDYDGKRLDDTLARRLESVRELLNNTVL